MGPSKRDGEKGPDGRTGSPNLSLRQSARWLRNRLSKKKDPAPPASDPQSTAVLAGSSGHTLEEAPSARSNLSGGNPRVHDQARESEFDDRTNDSTRIPDDSPAHSGPLTSNEELLTTQSLWDCAYENLRKEDEHLVKRYEELLLKEVHKQSPVQDDGAALDFNGTSRQAMLDAVIDQGMQRMEDKTTKYTIAGHEFVLRDQVSDAAKLVLSGKDLIREAMKGSPEASIVWSGVCLILPLLTNPTTADEANRDGFAYVSTRMRYYTALGPLLERLSQSPKVASALRTEANSHIIDLYQHILEFQISSVLRFYYGSLRRYGEDVLQRKDWKRMRLDIEKLDATVHQNLIQMNDLVERQELEDLNKICKELSKTSEEDLKMMQELLSISEQQLHVAKDQRGIAQKQVDLQEDEAKARSAKERTQCRQAFRITDSKKDATYEWYKDRIEDRVEGTCQWFLEHENFQRWLSKDSGPLLVSADPGCGKSVLAKYLINNVLPLPGVTVCYFFFKDQDQNTVRQALCALLHQLFSQKQPLIKHALEFWRKDGAGLVHSTSSLWNIFTNAVKDPLAGSVIMVLDALDECADVELDNLAQNLERQFCDGETSYKNLRYLLTSRPYEQIISSLQALSRTFPHVRIPGEGEKESNTISQEVNLVVKHRVDRMGFPTHVKSALERKLLEVPHRTYLWVYLVFDYLKRGTFKKTGAALEKAIATLPRNVNDAYEQILRKSTNPTLARKALCMVLAAKRPLSVSEMNIAVNTNEETRWLDDLDLEEESDFQTTLRNWCGLFVAIHHGKVYFLHQTAREFLLSNPALQLPEPASMPSNYHWKGSITSPAAQKVLAEACIRYLGFYGIGAGERPASQSNDSMSTATRESANDSIGTRESDGDGASIGESSGYRDATYDFLQYSALHWDTHFEEACFGTDAAAVTALVVKVCDPRLPSCSTWWEILRDSDSILPRHPGSPLVVATILGLDVIVEAMLAGGVDAEAKDKDEEYGMTPLSWAALSGHVTVAEMLVAHGVHVDANGGFWNRTPLSYAAESGDKDIVNLLLSHGAEVDSNDQRGPTPLLRAAMEGHDDVVGLLLAHGADVERKDAEYDQTPLIWAAESGHGGVVKLLLAHGVDTEAKDKDFGRTPLSWAIENGCRGVATLLLANGVDVEAMDEDSRTILSRAVTSRDGSGMTKLLLSYGVDVEAKDKDGRTPLSWAVTTRNEEIVGLLLDHGVKLEAADKNGRTPLSWAARKSTSLFSRFWAAREGAPPSWAGRKSGPGVVGLLLSHGVDVEAIDKDGQSPLLWAIREGDENAVAMLLDHGANGEVKDKDGLTPLLWAVRNSDEEVTKILLLHGVEVEVKDNNDRTPLSWALENGDRGIVRMLLAYGADRGPLSDASESDVGAESRVGSTESNVDSSIPDSPRERVGVPEGAEWYRWGDKME
ncbi:ankyrin repeat-containing domain protein [Chaetomium fimeti]|uniref:Ankyrin repeat-containing domain protein n=1 Tax=Chaetomium fimeti TaxID=1854472 RepID=A0AAE0HA97_9PEZI|nr:ankyrin repeat-containing domain protein [Chaetomium fimeti]